MQGGMGKGMFPVEQENKKKIRKTSYQGGPLFWSPKKNRLKQRATRGKSKRFTQKESSGTPFQLG